MAPKLEKKSEKDRMRKEAGENLRRSIVDNTVDLAVFNIMKKTQGRKVTFGDMADEVNRLLEDFGESKQIMEILQIERIGDLVDDIIPSLTRKLLKAKKEEQAGKNIFEHEPSSILSTQLKQQHLFSDMLGSKTKKPRLYS
ncbi:MAG TPA: hypothetical protein VK254_02535 [Candidatus Bathyarchaeia archaeon]|nr:hypothetical protein [Candidatus Bathyarchaeia archaeon]